MTPPVRPAPDTKDWTWAVRERCPDCGYDPTAVRRYEVPDRIRGYADAIARRLDGPEPTRRPQPTVWSPLEYACHARDVCELFGDRLELMLDVDDPVFANWDQDATALEDRYWAQKPAVVAGELRAAAGELADTFAEVTEWDRPGRRSDGSEFTVDTFARYLLHDLAHHVWDVS